MGMGMGMLFYGIVWVWVWVWVWIVIKVPYRISICFELLLVLLYLSKCIVYSIHSPLDLVVNS